MEQYVMNAAEQALVEALRWGKYEQGFGGLRRGNRFCCLGVACELYSKLGVGAGSWDEDWLRFETEAGSSETILPGPVKRWLGWRDEAGLLARVDLLALTDLNDSGVTFSQIADVIEAGLVLKENEIAEVVS